MTTDPALRAALLRAQAIAPGRYMAAYTILKRAIQASLAAAEAAPLDVELRERIATLRLSVDFTSRAEGLPLTTDDVYAALRSPDTEGAEPERRQLADNLIDAVEEALQAEALPANVHGRLQVAYDDVVEEANR